LSFVREKNTLIEVKDYIADCQHSRILVVGDTIDDVKGIVLKSAILKHLVGPDEDEVEISTLVENVLKVREETRADSLLELFQKEKTHLAIVLDEYGALAGVVTLEDVLEVITGEIMDETDEVPDLEVAAREKSRQLMNGVTIVQMPSRMETAGTTNGN
jgi:CBS domain containing-hemolysin-like protein